MKNKEIAKNVEDEAMKSPGGVGIRHLQTLLLFFGMVIGYCLRVSMSEAVVVMSKSSHQSSNHQFEVYDWSTTEKSTILSSFFWGYTVMQIPSGYIATVWSGQKLLSVGILICGILNVLTPTAAHFGGFIAVCACRVGMGLCQSCLLPCTHTLLSKWAPPSERARLGTFAYAGAQFGTVICFPISGVLAASSVGWPSLFYLFGVLAIVWGVVFFIFGSDSPSKDPRISETERDYILDSIKISEKNENTDNSVPLKTPWKAIFTSVPMWALIIVHCGQNWGYWTLITELPTYMDAVLRFNFEQNGMMSALPYLVMWILSFPVCWLADYALKKGVTRAVTRKVCNTIAHWGPAVALICLAAMSVHDSTLTVIILVIAVGLNAGSLCGFQINHIDLSPNFAGTMMSITNCIASVIAIIAPLICSVIVQEQTNVTQWNMVFYLSAAIYFVGNLIFIIFGKAEVQPWNNPETANVEEQTWFGCRHAQTLLMALGFFCCYAIRVTTSVTLEAMTNSASANPDFIEFPWDNSIKDVIQSSFFWGYIWTQIIGSIVAQRWGARKLFSLAQFLCGLITLFIPTLAQYCGWEAVCAARVIAGLSQGTVLPSLHTLLSKWAPIEERGRLSTFVYAGGWIGNVICLQSTGLLSASSLGWPSCFYIWGGITIASGVLFFIAGKESPNEHPGIPQDEKDYIDTSLGIMETEETLPTPWMKILTSVPMWALLIAQAAQNWGFWMLLTKIPSYIGSVFRLDIKQNGITSSLPYLTAWILSFPISYISDLLIRRNIVTVQASRKICNTIGQWIPGLALIGLGYVGKDQPDIAVLLLVVAVASNVAVYCGHNVNHMDLSPNFAGPLMGIANTAANVCSIMAPLTASFIVKDSTNVEQWRNIFLLSSIIYFVGNLVFILFGTSKIQKWNDPVVRTKDVSMNSVRESTAENGYAQKMKEVDNMRTEKNL